MTKRDRLSFALRQLRDLRVQKNPGLCEQEKHRIIKEVIDELSKGTRNADLAHYIIELLDYYYDQNTGILENGRLPTPPVMPDYTEQLCPLLQTLKTLASDKGPISLSATVALLHSVLAVFANGPNAPLLQILLTTVEELIQRESTLPPPLPDNSEQLKSYIEALSTLGEQEEPEFIREKAVRVLCQALYVLAQGPNELPISKLLDRFEVISQSSPPLTPAIPDYAEQIQPHIDTLIALDELDDPDAVTAAAAMTLYETLSGFAQGPNATPINALLDTFGRVTGAE